MQKMFGWLILVTLLALAGCAGGGDTTQTAAARAVESYYRAIVERDDDALIQTTCADWEEQALLEFDSFQGVETELENLACVATEGGEPSAEEAQVTCSGKIVASYGNELMDFPLDDRQHRVVNQGGDWRICGY